MSFLSKVLKGVAGVAAAPFTAGASLGLTADSVLGAGTQLLGGFLDRRANADAIAGQNAYNNPAAVRARAEAAGFNPLLFVGPNVGQQNATGSAYMGSAIADAGMILADGMSRKRESQKLSALQQQNQKLQDHIQSLTLRPKVAGIYAQNEQTPTLLGSLGRGSNAGVVAQTASVGKNSSGDDGVGGVGLEKPNPRETPAPFDPDRPVKEEDIKNFSGFFALQNAFTAHKPVYVYGDEPDSVVDLVLQTPIIAPQLGLNWGEHLGEVQNKWAINQINKSGGYAFTSGGNAYALQPSKPKPKPVKYRTVNYQGQRRRVPDYWSQ